MIKIGGTLFDTSLKTILETIRKETNGEYLKDIKIDEDSSKKIIIGDYTTVKIIDYNEYDLFGEVI